MLGAHNHVFFRRKSCSIRRFLIVCPQDSAPRVRRSHVPGPAKWQGDLDMRGGVYEYFSSTSKAYGGTGRHVYERGAKV